MLDEADKKYLKSITGAWEAYEGTRSLEGQLLVRCLQGVQVLINATVKQEFAQAPPSIKCLQGQSEAVLRQQFKIIAEVKLFDNRTALFLVAEDGHAFLLAKENVTLKRGTRVAGIGSGRMTQEAEDAAGPGPALEFKQGDRTLIEARLLKLVTDIVEVENSLKSSL